MQKCLSSTEADLKLPKRGFGLQWHVTNMCDQRCQHCYIWGKDVNAAERRRLALELDIEQCKAVVDSFIKFCEDFAVRPLLVMTGGDPLLRKGIWELLECIHSKGLSFSILGNPFHLSNEVCERLRLLGCRSYQMSLDGLEETHDYFRKPGSFSTTLRALPMLQRAGIRTAIMSTVSSVNSAEIPELVRTVVDHRVDGYSFGRYCPNGGDDEADSMMSPLEYRDFLSEMWDVYLELEGNGTKFTLKDHLWKLFLHEKGQYPIQEGDIVLQGCACGIKHMTLLPDGTVYACRRFESPVGNILTQSFEEIFLSQEMDQYRKVDQLEGCSECGLLNYCRGCHAVSYGLTGDFFSKDPQCWKAQYDKKEGKPYE